MTEKNHRYSNSPAYKRLVNLMGHIGRGPDEDDFLSLLTYIDAPPHLRHLLFPLAEFQAIAPIAMKISKGPLWRWIYQDLAASLETCEQLNATQSRVLTHLNDDTTLWLSKSPGTFRNTSFRNFNKSHPLYSTLGHRPRVSTYRAHYHHLQAHALIAYLCFQQEKNLIKAQNKLLQDGLAAVRSLTQKEYQSELDMVPVAPCTPEQYLRQITSTQYPKDSRIRVFAQFLLQAMAFNRNAHNKVGRKAATKIPEEENHVTATYRSYSFRDDKHDAQDYLQKPLRTSHPTKSSYDILAPPGLITRREPEHHNHNIRQASKQIAKDNQLLRFDWKELSNYDITALITEISKGMPDKQSDLNAYSYLHLMLWTGQSAAVICNLEIDAKSITNSYHREGYLRLISKGPKLKRDPKEYHSIHRVEKQDYLNLALPECAVEVINTAIANNPELLSAPYKRINQICTGKLSHIKNKHATKRLTIVRIQKHHFRLLSRMPGSDISTAALTLNSDDLLARTKHHYSSFNSESLEETFRESCCQILQTTGSNQTFTPTVNFGQTKHVGTPLRLKADIVRETVHKLQNEINSQLESISKGVATTKDIILYHNTYSTYTALMFCFGTGHRRAKTPYINRTEWDRLTQFGCIRDKDTADYQHSRLVWIPDICIQQMKNYREHILNIYRMTGLQVTEDMLVPQNYPELFFIHRKRAYVDYKTFAKKMAEIGYDFEGHPQRHFLKSELQERGCDPEILEAYLGHWNTGQEPWVRSSSLHPADFRKELKKYLPPLLASLDFKAIRGLTSTTEYSLTVSFPEKTRPNFRAKRAEKATSQIILSSPPGKIWFELLPKARRAQQDPALAFRAEQLNVLEKLKKHFPEIYRGEKAPPVTDQQMIDLIKDIIPNRTHPEKRLRRLLFLDKGLRAGSAAEDLRWDTPYPHVPKVMPTDKNRIRPDALKRFGKFRVIEKAFLKDLEKSVPEESVTEAHQIGQILLSAILYGGVLNKKWINLLPAALQKGYCQYGDWMWFALVKKTKKEKTANERFRMQSIPDEFRRWFPDPLTQLLIYRWLRNRGDQEEQDKTFSKSAWSLISSYISRLGIQRALKPKKLPSLLLCARPYHSLTLPSFLCSYAENLLPSASLPTPLWCRALTGSQFTVPFHRRAKRTSALIKLPQNHSIQQQKALLKKLKSYFESRNISEINTEEEKRKAVRKSLRSFLKEHRPELCPALQLLSRWAIQLLKKRKSEREGRQSEALEVSSVQTYITTIGEVLIFYFKDLNPINFELTEYIQLYELIAEEQNYDNKTLSRLEQFHKFLVVFYKQPEIDNIKKLSTDNKHLSSTSVSANFITVQQYHNILERLGWGKNSLTRNETMTLVAFILGYWTGMRKEEVHGLSLIDVQKTVDTLEFHIFPNPFRGLKTAASIRRNPDFMIAGDQEIQFLRDWVERRHLESPTGDRDKIPLFSKSQVTDQLIGDDALFGSARQTIKLELQDQSAVWHHLRDSGLENLYLRLLLRDDIPMEHPPYFIQHECFSQESRKKFREQLFPNDRSGRKTLFGGATLIGHADYLEGFKSYFHLTDWLLGYYVRHPEHLPSISLEAYRSLTGEKTSRHLNAEVRDGKVPSTLLYRAMTRQHTQFTNAPENLIHELLAEGIPVRKKSGRKRIEKGIPEFDVAYYKVQLAEKNVPLTEEELAVAKNIYQEIQKLSIAKQRTYQRLFQYLQGSFINHRRDVKYFQITERDEMIKIIKLLKAIRININLSKVTYHQSRYHRNDKSYSRWKKSLDMPLGKGRSCQIKGKRDCIRISNDAMDIVGQSGDIDILDILHFTSLSINQFEV